GDRPLLRQRATERRPHVGGTYRHPWGPDRSRPRRPGPWRCGDGCPWHSTLGSDPPHLRAPELSLAVAAPRADVGVADQEVIARTADVTPARAVTEFRWADEVGTDSAPSPAALEAARFVKGTLCFPSTRSRTHSECQLVLQHPVNKNETSGRELRVAGSAHS